MKIVQVPRRFVRHEWGGTETAVLETSKRLLARGHEVEILCPDALSDCAEETVGGVPVRRFPYFYPYLGLSAEARGRLDRVAGNLFSFALMRALAGVPDLDLVHLHTGKRLGGIVRRVARQRRIPYIVTLHGGVHDVPEAEARAWTEPTRGAFEWGKVLGWWVGSRRVLEDAAAILCVGLRECEKTRERYPAKRVIHLTNGVDAERFAHGDGARYRARHGIAPEDRVVLTVGRIAPQKNQRLAVEAVAELLAEDPSWRLVLIGPVTDDAYCRQADQDAAALGGRVTRLPGLAPDAPELVDAYHAADVFLLPSLHEPFGIVILEAWAAGRPVVASRVGGVAGLVRDEEDGLLFAPGDVAGCVAALRRLGDDAALAARLAEAGRRKAAEHSWDRVTARLLSIYEEAIRENPLRP